MAAEYIYVACEILGVVNVKEYQKEAIIKILEGRDVFISQPTGSGKSLVFQAAPLVRESQQVNKFCFSSMIP